MTLTSTYQWESPSGDLNDETFGDVVDSAALDAAPDYDALLVGEPFDAAVIGRRGAAEGPKRIREALAGVKTHQFGNGPIESRIGDVGDVGGCGDVGNGGGVGNGGDVGNVGNGGDIGGCGDVGNGGNGGDIGGGGDARDADTSTDTADPAAIQAAVRDVAREVHATAALPVFLGGDNSLTFANVAPLLAGGEPEAAAAPSEMGDSVGVINCDAHLDVREVMNGPTSGTPYRQLFDAGLDAYCCVGARHFETSTTYADAVTEQGGTVITAEAIEDDLDRAIRRVRDATDGVDRVYLSVDCDVLDAAAAPGVSAPTPGGLTTRELFRLVRRLAHSLAADGRLAGIEVVECAPPLDEGGRTVDAAARTVAHALGGALGHGERDGASGGGAAR